MKMINLKSRKGLVNLLADYVVSKLGSDVKSIIQITDCDSFLVVNGVTETSNVIDLQETVNDFQKKFSGFTQEKKINTIDLIKYGEEPKSNKVLKFSFLNEDRILCKSLVVDYEYETLQVSSYFPYGYSINLDRIKQYYSEYICYQLFSITHSEQIDLTIGYSDDNELYIKINSKSIYNDEDIESMILDTFNFDFNSFYEKIKDYDLLNDLLNPISSKPWLVRDRIKDMIII